MSKRLDKAIAGGLLVAIVFTALAQGTVEPWSVVVFEFIVIALILLWGIKAVADKSLEITIPTAALPLAALVVLGLAQSVTITRAGRSASLSMNVEATGGAVTTLFFLFVCFTIAANFFTTHKRLRTLAIFLTAFGVALALFALIQYFTWDGRVYWLRSTPWATVFGPFINRNHYAGYIEMLVPLPLALIVAHGVRKDKRLLYGFAAAVMGLTVLFSLSRGGMISMIAGLLFVAVMSARLPRVRAERRGTKRKASTALAGLGGAAAVAAAIIVAVIWIGADPVINRANQSIEEFDKADSGHKTNREWVWKDTWAMFRANPILGVGLGAYETVYPIYSSSDGSAIVSEAHNDYLQILADAGVVGGLLALWFIVVVFRAVARGAKSADPLLAGLALGSGAGLFSILVHSLLDFNLQIPSNALLFLTLSATASNIGAGLTPGMPGGRRSSHRDEPAEKL